MSSKKNVAQALQSSRLLLRTGREERKELEDTSGENKTGQLRVHKAQPPGRGSTRPALPATDSQRSMVATIPWANSWSATGPAPSLELAMGSATSEQVVVDQGPYCSVQNEAWSL